MYVQLMEMESSQVNPFKGSMLFSFYFICGSAIFLIPLYWFIISPQQQLQIFMPSEYNDNEIQQGKSNRQHEMTSRKKHIILVWTGQRYFFPNLTMPDYLSKQKCRFANCHFTYERFHLKEASALLFHARNLNNTSELPNIRHPEQYYVWYHRDRPVLISPNLLEFYNVFNLTMTYRLDSDAPVAYGKTVPQTVARLEHLKYRQSKLQFLKKDDRLPIAWMVSHCKTDSRREHYVQELRKHIQVDIYGKCGNLSCPKSQPWVCKRMIESNYKFYLSFENSFCKDYVTEKTFEMMKYYIVPIVMGSANYSATLPPNSFIDVNNFDSPRSLAQYLKKLGKQPAKYRSYFEWKENYTVKGTSETFTEGFCSLCEILNTQKRQHKVYRDIAKWQLGYCYDNTMDTLLRNV